MVNYDSFHFVISVNSLCFIFLKLFRDPEIRGHPNSSLWTEQEQEILVGETLLLHLFSGPHNQERDSLETFFATCAMRVVLTGLNGGDRWYTL